MVYVGNRTLINLTPGKKSWSFNHTQDVGAGKILLVSCVMASNRTFSSCKYNGVAMTQVIQQVLWNGSTGRRHAVYILTPDTTPPMTDSLAGTKQLTISFNNPLWNPISIYVQSFTDASAVAPFNIINKQPLSTPNVQSMTVSGGSFVYGMSLANVNITSLSIPTGSGTPFLYLHNTNSKVRGAIKENLPAGVVGITATSGSGKISLFAIEIGGVSTPVGGVSEGSFMPMFY